MESKEKPEPIPRPSFKTALWADYTWWVAVSLPFIGWGVALYKGFTQNEDSSMTVNMGTACTIIGMIVMAVRYWQVSYFYKHGVPVVGEMRDLRTVKSSAILTFEYRYEDKSYTQKASISEFEAGKLRVDPSVYILVDPKNPSKFFIYDVAKRSSYYEPPTS